MERDTLVSIIIPVYNAQPYLKEALDSVIHQTYGKLEIIIIDDGSTDRSGSICDDYAKKANNIHVIHQHNRGLSNARNTGLDIASGDYIAFLDADDAFHYEFVSFMINTLICNDVDIVCCKYVIKYSEGKIGDEKERTDRYPFRVYKREEALRGLVDNTIDHYVWNKLYKRQVWNGIRFPEGQLYEDKKTTHRVIGQCKALCTVNCPLYFYRRRTGSITNKMSVDRVRDWMLGFNSFESYIRTNIPQVYSLDHVRLFRSLQLSEMIGYYVRLTRENEEENKLKKALRSQIIEIGKEDWKKEIRTELGYLMIRYTPWIMPIVYPLYSLFRRCYLKHHAQRICL